jgi:hypothetical protein
VDGAVEIGGRRIAWRSLGEGRPLLLLNGYAATAVDWDPGFLAALARSFEHGHALMAQEPGRLADLIRSFVRAPGR